MTFVVKVTWICLSWLDKNQASPNGGVMVMNPMLKSVKKSPKNKFQGDGNKNHEMLWMNLKINWERTEARKTRKRIF